MIYCKNVDLDDIFVNNTGNVVSSCEEFRTLAFLTVTNNDSQ